MVSWILSRAGFRDAVPCLRFLQGCEDQKHPGICALDDVLDRLCALHGHRDLHRPARLLASLLLRDQDGFRHLAALPLHPRGQPALPQIRAPHAVPQGEGDRHVHHPGQGAQLRGHGAFRQEGPQHGSHRRGPGGHQEPGCAGGTAPQLQHAGPALRPRRGPRALPGPPVPGGAGEPQAASGLQRALGRPAVRERDGRRGALVGLTNLAAAFAPQPGPQAPLPQPEPARGEEEGVEQRGLFPTLAQQDQEESGSAGAGQLTAPGKPSARSLNTSLLLQHREGASPAAGRGLPPALHCKYLL